MMHGYTRHGVSLLQYERRAVWRFSSGMHMALTRSINRLPAPAYVVVSPHLRNQGFLVFGVYSLERPGV